MFDLDSFQEIWVSLTRHKLRTALTAIGVLFGILIFMLMVAFGGSLHEGVNKQFKGFASNAIFLFGQRTSEPYAGLPANRPVEFDDRDTQPLREVEGMAHVAPRNMLGGWRGGNVVKRGSKVGSYRIVGDYPDFQYIALPLMRLGRFVDDGDIAERRKIAVIGEVVAQELFGRGENPIGQAIQLNGIHFVVVGVFGTAVPGQQGDDFVRTVHVPFTTFGQAFHMGDRVGFFAVTGKPGVDAKALEQRVYKLLKERHKISPTDQIAIRGWNQGERYAKQQKMFDAIDIVLFVAGLLSLMAGAIGVSNIMLISVRERTKEIGVRKALGARPVSVVAMIVTEAVALTMLAGYIGLTIGVIGISYIADWIAGQGPEFVLAPPRLSFEFALFATGALVVVGALAGLIPAVRAAAISPVEALRDE